jgi:TolA-binding protein
MRRFSLIAGLKLAGFLSLVLPLLTGCETMMPTSSNTTQDIFEIKSKLNDNLDRQASNARMIDSQLNTLSQNLDKNNSVTSTAMDEMQRQLRAQAEEINKLRGEVEALNITIKNGIGGARTAQTFGTPGETYSDEGTTGSQNQGLPPAGVNASPAGQALATATQLFNGGQYAQAKEAYTQALSQNPDGDLKVDILFGLGETCLKLNDVVGAGDSYKQVIKSAPKNAKAWISLERMADIDIAQGNKAAAITKLEYIAKYPRYRDLARVQQKLAQLKGANNSDTPTPSPE